MQKHSQLVHSRAGGSRRAAAVLALGALSIALGACAGPDDSVESADDALRVAAPAPDAEPVVPTSITRITAEGSELQSSPLQLDLSRPGAVVQIDASLGRVDLSRIELRVGDQTRSAAALQETAAASAGVAASAGSFYVVSGADAALALPGDKHCSPLTQTDCCECGWKIGSLCAGFWCPCFGDQCGDWPPVLAR